MAVQESRLVISIDARNAERTAKALNSELQGITNNGNKATSQTNALGAAMQSLAGYMAGVVTVGAAINKIDAYTNLQNRLKLVTNSQQELNKAMNDTFGIAQRSYQTWDSVVQVYQRFSDNAKTLGINMEQTAKLTETVSKAVAVSGASTQAAEAALTQFGQALASGVLRGEELNSILEQTPALAKAIAQGMGITVGQLRSVAAEGKITGEVLVEALTKSADSVEQLFAKTDITISQSIGLLSNELTKFVGEAGQSSGAANLLAGSIKLLSENLSLLADAAVVGGIGYITKAILTKTVAVQGAIAASVAQKAADAAEAQSSIAVATAKVNEAKAHLANVQATNAETQAKYGAAAANARYKLASDAVTQALIAQTAAQGALNKSVTLGSRALALVGGPIGAITLGVSALAAGYLLLSNNVKDNTKSLRENNESVNDAIQKYRELDDVQKRAQLAKEKSDLKELSDSYENLTSKLNTNAYALSRHNDFTQAQSKEVNALIAEFKRTGDLDKFSASINKLSYVSQDSKDKFNALAGQVRASGNEYKNQKQFVDAMTNSLNQNADAGDNAARGIRNAAEAVAEYTGKLKQQKWDLEFTNALVDKHGKSAREADLLLQAYRENEKKGIKGVTAEQKELIKGIVAEEKAAQKRLELQRASASASKKAQSESDKARKKQENDNNRLIEQQARLRDSIQDTYDTEFEQIQRREAYALKDLEAAGFKPDEYKKYSEIIKNEYQAQRDEYLKNLTIELNEYTWTEDYKLEYAYKTDKAILENSNRTNGVIKERQLEYLDERYAYEKAQLELNKETRIFQAQQAIYSEMELIKKRYDLERRNIELTVKDLQERKALLDALAINQSRDEAGVRDQAISDYRGVMGFEENPLIKQFEVLDKMRELDLINEEAYQNAKLQLQAKSTAAYMEGMLGGFASLVDENSKTYAVLFAAQKAFAVAQAMLNIPAAYSKAYDAVVGTPYVGPYIAPAVGAAAAALQVAQAASIKSVNMSGFKSGGYTGNVGTNQVAGVVHGQEYVLNAEATKRVGKGTLDAINSGKSIPSNEQQQGQSINLNPNFVIVDERESLSDYLFSSDGTKAFVKFFRRNRSQLGF